MILCEKLQTWSFAQLQKSYIETRKNLIKSNLKLEESKQEITALKQNISDLQQNPGKLDNYKLNNGNFICLLLCSFYSPNWSHLCSAARSTRAEGFMANVGVGRC